MKTTLKAAAKGIYSAQQLAKKAGLSSRAFAHHLARLDLIRPITPKGFRARFDDDALQVAKVFAALQSQGSGMGPKTLLKGMAGVVRDYAAKIEREEIQPLKKQTDDYARKIWDDVLDAVLSIPYRDSMAADEWRKALWAALQAREFAEKLADKTMAYRMLMATQAEMLLRDPGVPLKDPAWAALDPFLGGSQKRADFLRLLYKTGVLQSIIASAWPKEGKNAR